MTKYLELKLFYLALLLPVTLGTELLLKFIRMNIVSKCC